MRVDEDGTAWTDNGSFIGIVSSRLYAYQNEVRDENGELVHRAGDVVVQVRDAFGFWRDSE